MSPYCLVSNPDSLTPIPKVQGGRTFLGTLSSPKEKTQTLTIGSDPYMAKSVPSLAPSIHRAASQHFSTSLFNMNKNPDI